jgi:hypothetical protein
MVIDVCGFWFVVWGLALFVWSLFFVWRLSRIKHPESNIQNQASRIKHPLSIIKPFKPFDF